MTFSLSAERHFSVSAFTALAILRSYINQHGVEPEVAATSLKKIDATFVASDSDAAYSLHGILPQSCSFEDRAHGYRQALAFLIDYHSPAWRKFAPNGRARVSEFLTETERQLFLDAGLLDAVPGDAALHWWYQLQSTVRGERDARLAEQGGKAELLTLEYERERLRALGIHNTPEWTGLDMNGVGYDVKSWDVGPHGPIARLIEVKSSTSMPPRAIVTRNEWKSAELYGNAFRFHLWLLPCKKLREITVDEMRRHVPHDRGEGSWLDVEITFSPDQVD